MCARSDGTEFDNTNHRLAPVSRASTINCGEKSTFSVHCVGFFVDVPSRTQSGIWGTSLGWSPLLQLLPSQSGVGIPVHAQQWQRYFRHRSVPLSDVPLLCMQGSVPTVPRRSSHSPYMESCTPLHSVDPEEQSPWV